VISILWTVLAKRGLEPASPYKQAFGLFFLALGYVFIAFGVDGVEPGVKVSMVWLTGLYLIHTIGELFLSPIGLSMVNKLSPVRFASLLMGVWFLSTAAANNFAGFLSSFYPEPEVTAIQVQALEKKYSTDTHQALLLVTDSYKDSTVVLKNIKADAAKDSLGSVAIESGKTVAFYYDKKTKKNIESAQIWVASEKDVEKTKATAAVFDSINPNITPLKDSLGNDYKLAYSNINWSNLFPKTKDKTIMAKQKEIIQKEKIAMAKLAINKEKDFLGLKINDLKSFFWLFVYLAGGSSIILFLLSKLLVKMMHGVK
jgi:POT family proton-dependent oligopeptide transporter